MSAIEKEVAAMSSLQEFKQSTREWLEENCPESMRGPAPPRSQIWGGRNRTFPSDDAKIWFERMRDRGWTAPTWPKEYGGGGLSTEEAQILSKEMQRIGARTPLFDLGLMMLGPALLELASEEIKQTHLPPIVRGDIRWCQGYSEPGAGSDLASLQCKAEDKGDHFLVNGTKIWSSYADKSDWMFCLVRTNTEVAKQQGITFLLIDMASEGISTSPIELISGESEFCQTFLDNVKVPKENLVGEVDQGWTIAKAVLAHERKGMSEMPAHVISDAEMPALAKEYLGERDGKLDDSSRRGELTDYLMNARAFELTGFRMFLENKAGNGDPRLPLIMKYASTRKTQVKDELLLAILGNRGLSMTDEENFTDKERATSRLWAMAKAYTVAGGTSEIQLNIIAKRALELPQN